MQLRRQLTLATLAILAACTSQAETEPSASVLGTRDAAGSMNSKEDGTDPDGAAPHEPRILWVNHYLAPCSGWEGKYTCHLIANSSEGPWLFGYDPLHDFAFQWGHVYQVELSQAPGGDGADAPAVRTLVSKILADLPVDPRTTTFDIEVDPVADDAGHPLTVQMASETQGKVLDGPSFTCRSADVCRTLAELTGGTVPFAVSFRYSDDLSTLLAQSVSTQ